MPARSLLAKSLRCQGLDAPGAHGPTPIALAKGSGPDLTFETQLKGEGFRVIAGLDEAGRGAWAGPVTAAAVVLPNDSHILESLWRA